MWKVLLVLVLAGTIGHGDENQPGAKKNEKQTASRRGNGLRRRGEDNF